MAADKSIVVRLSLIDAATPELQKFMKTVQGLEGVIAGINRTITSFNAGLASIASSVGGATSSMNTASSAASGFESKLNQATTAMRNLAGASGEAASAAGRIGNEMNTAGGSVNRFEERMGSLATTIRGVGEAWAGAKIGHGLAEAGKEAAEYERTQTRLANLNLGDKDNQMLKEAANATSAGLPQIDKNKALEMAHDLVNVTGSAKEAAHELDQFARAAVAIKYANPKGEITDKDVLGIAKALELRGASQDPARLEAELNKFAQIIATTQGRVGPSQLLGNIKYAKGGLGNSMDIGFLSQFASMIELVQSSGGNGGQVGVMLSTLQKTIINGPEKGRRANWQNNGLLDDQGNVVGRDEFQKNPYEWVQKFLKPALLKAGVDLADTARVNMILNSLSSNKNSVEGMSLMTTRSKQIDKDSALIENSAGITQQNDRNLETSTAKWDALQGSLHNLYITVGENLAPAFKIIVDLVNDAVKAIDEFMTQHDVAGSFIMMGTAISGAGLALGGFLRIFGLLGPSALGGFGAAGAAATGFLSKMGPWGLALTATFAAAFSLTDALFNATKDFQLFGTTIENMVNQLVSFVINAFRQIGNFISTIVLGQMKATLDVASTAASAVGMDKLAGLLNSGSQKVSGAAADFRRANEDLKSFSKSFSEGQTRLAADKVAGRVDKDGNPIGSLGAAPVAAPSAEFDFGKEEVKKGRKKDGWVMDPTNDGKGGSGRKGRDPNNIAANEAAENAKFERERTALELRATEALYRQHVIGIDELTAKKAAAIRAGVAEEIAALEKERAFLMRDPAKNADKIAAVSHKIELVSMKEKLDLLDIEYQKKEAIESLDRDGLNIQEKLDNITNSGSKAKIALLDLEYQKKRKILEINGQLAAAQALDQLHIAEVAKVGLDDQKRKQDLLKNKERTAEMGANADAKSGKITNYEAQQKIIEAKREQGRQELINLDAMERYANSIKDESILEAIKQQKIEAQGLADTLDLGAQQFKDTMHSAIEGGLNDLMKGKFSFKKFFTGIADMMNQTLTKGLADTITNALFGKEGMFAGAGSGGGMIASMFGGGGQSQGGGLGGFFSNLFGGGASGGGAGAAAGDGAGGILSGIGSFLSGLFSFDVGADSIPRDMIARIHKDEMILPAATAKKVRDGMSGGGGGKSGGGSMKQTVNFNMNSAPDKRTRDQMAKQIATRRVAPGVETDKGASCLSQSCGSTTI